MLSEIEIKVSNNDLPMSKLGLNHLKTTRHKDIKELRTLKQTNLVITTNAFAIRANVLNCKKITK